MYKIKASIFAKLATLSSTEETRYYLNGVYLHRRSGTDGIVAVSTDGHRMGVWRDETGFAPEGNGIIVAALPALVRACAAKMDRQELRCSAVRYLIVDETTGTATVQTIHEGEVDKIFSTQTFSRIVIDGNFPDYQRIVPMSDSFKPSVICVNAAYLASFGKMGKGPITIATTDITGPMLVRVGDDECRDFFGIVMPMRGASASYPAWWTRETSEETVALAA